MDKAKLATEVTDAEAAGAASAQTSGLAWNSVRRTFILWVLFFLICFGLGYPTFRYYDPRTRGPGDSSVIYYEQVTGEPLPNGVPPGLVVHYRYRVLVPYLAKPVYWLARGRVGTWEPVFFALLVVNASLTATTALLLLGIGYRVLHDYSTSLLGAMLYLSNFAIANFYLAGLVDSGEAVFMMATAWTLFADRWKLLPLLGLIGVLAKETFLPFSMAFAFGWWVAESRQSRFRLSKLAWIGAMGLVGFATLTTLHSIGMGHIVWVWDLSPSVTPFRDGLAGLFRLISDRGLWYVFMWLLPLGAWKLRYLPRSWVTASIFAAITVLIIGVWNNEGTVNRSMFNVTGPLLSLSVAMLLNQTAARADDIT